MTLAAFIAWLTGSSAPDIRLGWALLDPAFISGDLTCRGGRLVDRESRP
jgi:hypothetical protein